MGRKSLVAAEAAALAIISFWAKLRLDKQEIAKGFYRADLRIVGTVAGHPIDWQIVGDGTQSGPQTVASSEGPGKDEVAAYLLSSVPRTRWDELIEQGIAYYADAGELPGVSEAALPAVKRFLKMCRASTSKTKAGAFTFAEAPDPDDLAAACERAAA